MTETDLATRAPESDAAADAPPATASAGEAGLSEHCLRFSASGHPPTKGETRKLGGVDVYVSKPDEYPHAPARLLLLLTGGTGLRSTNNQIQADMFADNGFVVVMPDLFGGDVAPNSATTLAGGDGADTSDPHVPLTAGDAGQSSSSFLDLFKTKAVETVKSFLIDMWLARHTEAKVLPILRHVLEASRDEFADAVSSGDGVYAVGYCFGGRYVLLLAGDNLDGTAAPAPAVAAAGATNTAVVDEDVEATAGTKPLGPGPWIKAGALAHATLVSPDDFQGLQAPISMVCVENDPMFPDAVRTAGEDYLSKHHVEHEVQVYPGVPHGFAVVGDYAEETIKTAQATAFEQMLSWLNAH
ncbi:dienelactone hydrolase family protein [Niveomyces insectorum RCEF 264]|uniref:Dienelactone hydrolase family protein n=1 Tax=Niveomyces insectorum RCEF 264 TaxID=1081102 RepID=A0A168A142_9HYPO|nr:dienelactone hydrolase family protein [Niveomyces insectorum RCEF 264]